jgi:hypothetical protein
VGRRLTLDLTRQLRQNLKTNWGIDGPWQWGTVAAVVTGGTFATVSVYLDNSSGGAGAVATPAISFLNGYQPTVGDVVIIARWPGASASRTQRVVIGCLETVGHGISQNGVFHLGTSITAGRPSAVTQGAGAVWYDTTLSKPIFSDGTVWRDAAGNAV